MSSLEALIFDVDGTLSDTERDGHRVAFNRAFADAGLSWDWSVETYGELLAITGGKERIRHYLDNYNPDFSMPENLDEYIAGLHAAKTAHYIKLLENAEIPLRPGVERLLNEAREAGLRLAIATTTTPVNVTTLLKSTLGEESLDWFEVIAAGDIVPQKKPAADIYDYALEHMSIDAANCIAFEDSRNGIISSHGANLKTIITTNAYTEKHDFTGACMVVDSMGDDSTAMHVIDGHQTELPSMTIELVKEIHAQCEFLAVNDNE